MKDANLFLYNTIDAIKKADAYYRDNTTKIIHDFKLVGLNLSQEMFDSIPKYYNQDNDLVYPYLSGVPVYKKEGIHKIQYIIEGTIESPKMYLKWSGLKNGEKYEVILNGKDYIVSTGYYDGSFQKEFVYLQTPDENHFAAIYDEEIFDNLKLELKE